eukprot:COSAG01_NODE_836_length_13206_cov_139.627375_20_plen_57_part_00
MAWLMAWQQQQGGQAASSSLARSGIGPPCNTSPPRALQSAAQRRQICHHTGIIDYE